MIVVLACPHDGAELVKCVASLRSAGLIGRKVAGDDVGRIRAFELAEVPAAARVGGRVNFGGLSEERITTRSILRLRPGGVAVIASHCRVHQVAAQSHGSPIVFVYVQMHGGYL